jgi:glycosyltransferase involved in cell wall biosynthesis
MISLKMKGERTIFSIITPSCNQGEFLADTIESVISQAGDFVIDYIVVDGGSTDNSVNIIKRYDALLQKGGWLINCRGITFRWLSEKDRGQTDALIKGFRMAEGELFAWLNSDDTYLPGTLQTAVDFFQGNPEAGLLYGDAHYCNTAGTIIGRYRAEEFDFKKLAWFNFICQPSTFFRREVFHTVGGLDKSLHFAMDYDLWVRIGKRFPCSYLPRFLATYRLHETSKTVQDETLYANCEEALSLAMKYFGWAPLTRVYNSCHSLCRAKLPAFLTRIKPAVIVATVICSLVRSLQLNRGIRRKDLKLLNQENFRKLFRSRIEIMTGKDKSGSKK